MAPRVNDAGLSGAAEHGPVEIGVAFRMYISKWRNCGLA